MIDGSYDYLLRMPIYSLTKEVFDKLKEELINKNLDGIWVYDIDRISRDVSVGDEFRKFVVGLWVGKHKH